MIGNMRILFLFSLVFNLFLSAFYCPASASVSVPEAFTGFQMPIEDYKFGYTYLSGPIDYQYCKGVFHPGVDLSVNGTSCDKDRGTNVKAVADGLVRDIGYNDNEWGTIVIEHNYGGITIYSQYGHLDTVLVQEGETVLKGQHIGEMGDVGTKCVHLHFEIRKNEHSNPTYAPAFCSVIEGKTKDQLAELYEDPIAFINTHPPYGMTVFNFNNESSEGWTAGNAVTNERFENGNWVFNTEVDPYIFSPRFANGINVGQFRSVEVSMSARAKDRKEYTYIYFDTEPDQNVLTGSLVYLDSFSMVLNIQRYLFPPPVFFLPGDNSDIFG